MNARPFIFSGLPGVGKTTLAKELARHMKAVYFRIDTIEHGIQELCGYKVTVEGYRLTQRIARDNLILGNSAVIDCCNPLPITRSEWEQLAVDTGAQYHNIEVTCSDAAEHRRRVAERPPDIENFILPTWEEVTTREYVLWDKPVIRIDTAGRVPADCFTELIDKLQQQEID